MLIVLVVVGAGIYVLFFARLLDVREVRIEVRGDHGEELGQAINDWLDDDFLKIKKRNNTLILSSDTLATDLMALFPRMDFLNVEKELPHILLISGQERSSAGIWCVVKQDRCFHFDKNGVAFADTGQSSGFLILNVNDSRERSVKLGESVAEKIWLDNMIKSRNLIVTTGVVVSGFVVPQDSLEEFHAQTTEGWKIMFSTSTDIEKQINALGIFLREKINKNDRSELEYIDLRVQDRIYYK